MTRVVSGFIVILLIISTSLAGCTSDGAAGVDGAQGPPGPAGSDGADGEDGEDGAQGPPGPAGSDGADGEDGEDGEDGAQGPPGPAGSDGADGEDGQDGANGTNGSSSAEAALSRIREIPASWDCTNGTLILEHGRDNGNGGGIPQNGILEDGEVESTIAYCHNLEIGPWETPPLQWDLWGFHTTGGSALYYIENGSLNAFDVLNRTHWIVGLNIYGSPSYIIESVEGIIYMRNATAIFAYDIVNDTTFLVYDLMTTWSSYRNHIVIDGPRLYLLIETWQSSQNTNHLEIWVYEHSNGSTWLSASGIDSGSDGEADPGLQNAAAKGTRIYWLQSGWPRVLHGHDTSNRSTWTIINDWSFVPDDGGIKIVDSRIYLSGDMGWDFGIVAYETTNDTYWKAWNSSEHEDELPETGFPGIFPLVEVVDDSIYFATDSNAEDGRWDVWELDLISASSRILFTIGWGGDRWEPLPFSIFGDQIFFANGLLGDSDHPLAIYTFDLIEERIYPYLELGVELGEAIPVFIWVYENQPYFAVWESECYSNCFYGPTGEIILDIIIN